MSIHRFAQETAHAHDERLARMAETANRIANETQDARWNDAALALMGARRFFRVLMQYDQTPVSEHPGAITGHPGEGA